MLSEVAHRQPQHRFPHSPYSPHHDASKNFPSTQGATLLGTSRLLSPPQNASYSQRSERLQQHARPVRSTATLPQQLHSSTPNYTSSESSEHMLRRKTPNGTLAAGYDGSPVEWSKRPHAVKHYLIPASSQLGYRNGNSFGDQTSVHKDQSLESRIGQQLHLQQPPSDVPEQCFQQCDFVDQNKTNASWRSNAVPPAGLDSVLNQSSLYHHGHNMNGSQHVPTVLQPMWPPSLGPTSIQSPGPFGPYWPNGAFEPYRPAPLQDPRFQSQADSQNTIYANQVRPAVIHYDKWLQSHGNLHHPYPNDHPFASNSLIDHKRGDSGSSNFSNDISSGRSTAPGSPNVVRPGSRCGLPLTYRNKSSLWKEDSVPPHYDCYVSPGYSISGLAESPFYTPQDPSRPYNGQFKEKILVWAQRIYGSLLASIEQARRRSGEQHHASVSHQSNYYPQPPRRPYPSWSNIHGRDTRSYSNLNASTSTHSRVIPNGPISSSPSFEYQPQRYTTESVNLSPLSSAYPTSTSNPEFRQRLPPYGSSPRSHALAAQPSYVPPQIATTLHHNSPSAAAVYAIDMLGRLCHESGLEWTDGMLLTGCLAYGLGDYSKAMNWYLKVLHRDSENVEAMSNLAATLLALNRRDDAEHYWIRSVKLRPSYFEAIEHLIGLLHEAHRGREAVKVIDFVEHSLRIDDSMKSREHELEDANNGIFPVETYSTGKPEVMGLKITCYSGYSIPSSDNGRMLALIHGKGNMLYQLGDNAGAARAFEDAILIGAGKRLHGIRGLIKQILSVFTEQSHWKTADHQGLYGPGEPILLAPDMALETSRLVFAPHGRLPGLDDVPDGFSQRAAVSIVSNSLLSLAKIYQDGMSSSGASANAPRATSGVQEILALYYLSLSLQPSPSTANNVGILLASVQQSGRARSSERLKNLPATTIPGVVPGSGIALALAYYDYGLKLDARHAHLYTNLGSLFKDIGQLQAAIKMYEKAVECDGNFDIALANLANAVKDQGKVSDAIVYYKRAVTSNPDFAEAVCGLANALNSVCSWNGRGGIHFLGSNRDRWHVNENGDLYDSRQSTASSCGWIERVVAIVEKQLRDGEGWGRGVLHNIGIQQMLQQLGIMYDCDNAEEKSQIIVKQTLQEWADNRWEGAKVVRLVERATKNLVRRIYLHQFIEKKSFPQSRRLRPQLPAALAVPSAPTVLPFHTFTCPLSAKQIRKISQRNGLRVSCSTLRAPWLSAQVYDPPLPPNPHLNVGYISSDFNNHPLAHLMQSVFGLHDEIRVKAFCYATTVSDGSAHRQQIEREAPSFHDASSWSIERLVNQVVSDGIHILVNLNGYTRGARNEVFAARPAPVQMSFMGFAGTLGAEWCDYLLADKIAIPPQTLRPWRNNTDLSDQTKDGNNDDDQEDWVYGENIIFSKDTFFCCDHRQSAPDSQEARISWPEEQLRRWEMRKELFPDMADDTVILGNFNQLYKVRVAHWFLTCT